MLWQTKSNKGYIKSPVDDTHLLYKINKHIDFSPAANLVISSYSKGHGRSCIDPEIFFRMLVISFLYNINSERRLCQEIRYNLAYRWFSKIGLKDQVPDHSWLSKTRKRFGEKVFEELFNIILELCRKKGLLDAGVIITDSTLIKANASLDSVVPIEAELAASEKVTTENTKSKLGPPPSRKIGNSTHVSKTDKESSLAQKEGSPRELKYKVHTSIDSLSRVIIDTKVTTGKTHECGVYIERINYITQKHFLAIKEVIAARAYGSREIIESLEIIETLQQEGITIYIPLFSTQSGKSIQSAYKAGFTYQKDHDRFICSAGKYLNPYGFISNESKYYRSKSSDCAACLKKDDCIALSKGDRKIKYLIRNIHQELFDKTLEAMQSPIFISKLLERTWKVEEIFAEAKQLHGLNKARYRGLEKVQIQAYMVAIVQNIKRLIKHLLWPYFQSLKSFSNLLLITFSTAPTLS